MTKYFAPLVEQLEFKAGSGLRKLLDAEPYEDDAVERFYELLAEDVAL